jgi:hypothetical protein
MQNLFRAGRQFPPAPLRTTKNYENVKTCVKTSGNAGELETAKDITIGLHPV